MRSGKILLGVLAGVAVGASLGILFAPARGSSTRRKISRTSDEYADELGEKFNEFSDSIRDKFQKVRKGVTEVQNYQDGFKVFHNFIRKGVKDKLTPAERCGIGVNGNRWNTLLLNSIKSQNSRDLTGEDKLIKTP